MGFMQKLEWLRKQTATLVYQASRDRDPELYAEVMLDNLPPFFTAAEIMEHLGKPDAVQSLAQLNPAVRDHLEWFEDFRQAAIDILNTPDEPEAEAPAAPGLVTPVDDPPA